MYYTTHFKTELQTSRFDRWRINYELLLRVIEAKENQVNQNQVKQNQVKQKVK